MTMKGDAAAKNVLATAPSAMSMKQPALAQHLSLETGEPKGLLLVGEKTGARPNWRHPRVAAGGT